LISLKYNMSSTAMSTSSSYSIQGVAKEAGVVVISQQEYDLLIKKSDVAPVNIPRSLEFRGKSLLSHMKMGGRGGFKNLKPFKTKIWTNTFANVSSASSALVVNGGILLNGTNFGDLAAIQGLFDEMRVLGVTLHYHNFVSTASTQPTIACNAITFDPNTAAPGSIAFIASQTFHGPVMFMNGAVSTYPSTLNYSKLHVKVPAKLAPISSSDCPGNAWFALDQGTAPNLCNILSYTVAGTGGGVTNFSYLFEFDIELKIRA